jgi:creatinine amidohydrolase
LKVPSLRGGWAWSQRGWLGEVTQDTGVGNPAKADAKKGEAFLAEVIAKISVLLKEIADLDLKNPYE